MRRFLLFFAFAAVLGIAFATTTVTIDEINCALNITANDVNIPDESATNHPTVTVTKQDTALVFEITDASLAAQVFVKIVTSSATFTAYDWTGGKVGDVLTLVEAEAEDAITVKPGAFAGCTGTTGCDGLHLDTIALKKLFPANTSYVLFDCVLEYSSNGSVTLVAPFYVLALPKARLWAADTVLGLQPVTTNISVSGTITPTPGSSASASSSFWTTSTIWGFGVAGGILVLILVTALGCWIWSHDKLGGDRREQVYGQAAATTEMQGKYATHRNQPVPAQHSMLGHHRHRVTSV